MRAINQHMTLTIDGQGQEGGEQDRIMPQGECRNLNRSQSVSHRRDHIIITIGRCNKQERGSLYSYMRLDSGCCRQTNQVKGLHHRSSQHQRHCLVTLTKSFKAFVGGVCMYCNRRLCEAAVQPAPTWPARYPHSFAHLARGQCFVRVRQHPV